MTSKRPRAPKPPKAFYAALLFKDGRIVHANAVAHTADEAVDILVSVTARYLHQSYDAIRDETKQAVTGKKPDKGLPYVSWHEDSPAPHIAPPLAQRRREAEERARSGDVRPKRPKRRSRPSRRSR